MSGNLQELLAAAKAASPNERIDLRDAIAAFGEEAVDEIRPWLEDELCCGFAVRVLGRIAETDNHRQAAVDALRAAGLAATLARRTEIDAALARVGAPGVVRSGSFGPIDDAAIRDRLILAARRREHVYYSDLAQATGREMKGPHWAVHLGKILGRISSDETEAGRPMLSAIVVSRETKLPGEGFFKLGVELHRVDENEDEEAFARRQMERVYDYFANH
jgi:hypothetical protein